MCKLLNKAIRFFYRNRIKTCTCCGVGFSIMGIVSMLLFLFFVCFEKNSERILYLLSSAIIMGLLSSLFFCLSRKADDSRIAFIEKIRQQKLGIELCDEINDTSERIKVLTQISCKLFDI